MKRKYFILLCLIILVMSGCMQKGQISKNNMQNPTSLISASYSMADLYNVTLKNNSSVKSGTDGNAPKLFTLSNGTTVRVLGKVDNKWYVVMPSNNMVGVIPISDAAPAPSSSSKPVPSTPNAPTSGNTSEESAMLSLLNTSRTNNGLKALKIDEQITKVARLKAQDLAKNNYFSHVSPTYGSPFDMMKKYGISYLYAGENLAKNTNVNAAETALMNSPSHRQNILNSNFNYVGIGVASDGNGSKIYTQMFVGR
ncbi:MAG: CAP domain-containing protein [Clostridiales bacterium]|nr:CAP domain-containing protein [Clostridiales bacterium]